MKKLSIIVPVYNVEKYIKACLESIFLQGLSDDEFEVIIVNDGTKDKSMIIIADLIKEHNNVTIVNQQNIGLSMARNNGMEKATGDYILFVDSDDMLVEGSLSFFFKNEHPLNAELIVASFQRMTDEEIKRTKEDTKSNYYIKRTTGSELLINHLNPRECYVWRTFYKREFLIHNQIKFIPNICFEDIPFTHECYLKAGNCLISNKPIYIYRIRNASITTALTKKTGMDFGSAIAKTWDLIYLKDLMPEVIQKVKDNVFISLTVLLYVTAHNIPSSQDRKEILNHLKQIAPHMRFTNGTKQIIINFIYHQMLQTYMTLRVTYIKLSNFVGKHSPNKN